MEVRHDIQRWIVAPLNEGTEPGAEGGQNVRQGGIRTSRLSYKFSEFDRGGTEALKIKKLRL